MADWPVADISLLGKRVLEKLQACPVGARYTYAVGTNSEFVVKQEITDSILIIDQAVCLDIIGTPGHPYASLFMTLSETEFDSGTMIAEHMGSYGDVVVSIGDDYEPGKKTKSRDEILQMIDCVDLYGASRFYYLENNVIYHCGTKAKVNYPVFEKTAVCQSPQQYEDVLEYGSLSISEKIDGADPFFRKQDGLYQAARGLVKAGAEYIPAAEQLEASMRAAA